MSGMGVFATASAADQLLVSNFRLQIRRRQMSGYCTGCSLFHAAQGPVSAQLTCAQVPHDAGLLLPCAGGHPIRHLLLVSGQLEGSQHTTCSKGQTAVTRASLAWHTAGWDSNISPQLTHTPPGACASAVPAVHSPCRSAVRPGACARSARIRSSLTTTCSGWSGQLLLTRVTVCEPAGVKVVRYR